MIKIVKTNSSNSHFIDLVNQLDAYLKVIDGEEHDFYNQYNSIESLKHTVVAYINNKPIACGAFKKFNATSVEIKRMFTLPEARSQGAASKLLKVLEHWAKDLGYTHCVLETGIRQEEAVNFYKKNEYKVIANYGQYIGIENSLCFQKELV